MQHKKIFISHSSADKDFASWVSRLLICLGVDQNAIFYSSDFSQGARQQISLEVHQALKATFLDIIILSEQYKQSEYCINEAGIIWFKNQASKSKIIVIALPSTLDSIDQFEIIDVGFITRDFIQYQLLSDNFFNSLCNRLKGELSLDQNQIGSLLENNLIQNLNEYKCRLPIVENLETTLFHTSQIREDIRQAWEKIQTVSWRYPRSLNTSNLIFYKSYCRQIRICIFDSMEDTEKITVNTSTECIIVNLSDQNYTETYSTQFLREGGGYDTYQENFQVKGAIISEPGCSAQDNPFMDNPYITHIGPTITVPKHSCAGIQFTTSYDIKPERFFQSKILRIPCAVYIVDVTLDESIKKNLRNSYILRSQFIPPNPHNLKDGTVPAAQLAESVDKRHVHFECCNGFPAGGGYVLTISKKLTTNAGGAV